MFQFNYMNKQPTTLVENKYCHDIVTTSTNYNVSYKKYIFFQDTLIQEPTWMLGLDRPISGK